MGRKRKSPTGLPSRWEHSHGGYFYRVPEHVRDQWEGKSKFLLGHTLAEAYATWYARVDAPRETKTMGQAFTRYVAEVVPSLSPKTQRDYLRAIAALRPVFEEVAPASIEPMHVRKYMRLRPRVLGNREKAVLSTVLSWCVEWGEIRLNPVKGQVRRNTEAPRDRYVTDAEVEAFLAHCSPMLRAYVNLKLLTGVRQGQLLGLSRSDWDGERLTVPKAKGGKAVVYRGEALQDAIADVLRLRRGKALASMFLFATRNGGRYTGEGFRSIWQRVMRKYLQAGGARFTEHDLRAKVASDAEGLERAADHMGHQSSGITRRVYRRKPAEVVVNMPQRRDAKEQ